MLKICLFFRLDIKKNRPGGGFVPNTIKKIIDYNQSDNLQVELCEDWNFTEQTVKFLSLIHCCKTV